jgi:hypothetical protein
MNIPSIRANQKPNTSATNDLTGSPGVKSDQQQQQFRAMIEPLVYRARQLGLSRVQIREIITSLARPGIDGQKSVGWSIGPSMAIYGRLSG